MWGSIHLRAKMAFRAETFSKEFWHLEKNFGTKWYFGTQMNRAYVCIGEVLKMKITPWVSQCTFWNWNWMPEREQKLLKISPAQAVKWLKISNRANFEAHSKNGIEFLGSNYNSILLSSFAFNCTPMSCELSKLFHSKTWIFTLTQPFHPDFWLPAPCSAKDD